MTAERWRDEAQRLGERLRPLGNEQAVVAFQGERGAFGFLVVERIWGTRAWVLPSRTFADVIAAVEEGKAEYGVLPVRNTIIGDIPGVRSALDESALHSVGEVVQPVRHCLLGHPHSTLADITSVYSHPAALAQCVAFLRRNPAMVPREAYDTAGAARDVAARGRGDEAAIASDDCVDRYGLQLLARDVGDTDDNATTFVVVARRATAR
jgi:prephenate dehydratase